MYALRGMYVDGRVQLTGVHTREVAVVVADNLVGVEG
jgi:hypothetical protein